jgi:hypothetical protein
MSITSPISPFGHDLTGPFDSRASLRMAGAQTLLWFIVTITLQVRRADPNSGP